MKDYHIRIENGHHVVNMDYRPSELELAFESAKKGFILSAKQMEKNFEGIKGRWVNFE